jgi:UDP-N-acetylmuramoylalanine--D-glutamate ligase
MNVNGMNILVVGLARTGIATVKTLVKHGANVTANDIKPKEELDENFKEIEGLDITIVLGEKADALVMGKDIIIVSPGIPTSLSFFEIAKKEKVEVISEVELAYRLCEAPIIAITGTNGKTTTTSLVGDIFKRVGKKTYIVGNIGNPFIEIVDEATPQDMVVLELSSFQLETIRDFHPSVAAILNITPDHLDRHKTFEAYCDLKARVFENMMVSDVLIYNTQNQATVEVSRKTQARRCGFGLEKQPSTVAWVEEGEIITNISGEMEKICRVEDIFIPGNHNVENVLAAIIMTKVCGVGNDIICESLKQFKGVEHRIEYVACINDVTYFNDSKGTNPESVMKAVGAMVGETILIAGGYDKHADYDELMGACKGRVKQFVLLGETAEKIKQSAKAHGFTNITMVDTMQKAVQVATNLAINGDNILLSPACASWDMYDNYEQRGKDFKQEIAALREG